MITDFNIQNGHFEHILSILPKSETRIYHGLSYSPIYKVNLLDGFIEVNDGSHIFPFESFQITKKDRSNDDGIIYIKNLSKYSIRVKIIIFTI